MAANLLVRHVLPSCSCSAARAGSSSLIFAARDELPPPLVSLQLHVYPNSPSLSLPLAFAPPSGNARAHNGFGQPVLLPLPRKSSFGPRLLVLVFGCSHDVTVVPKLCSSPSNQTVAATVAAATEAAARADGDAANRRRVEEQAFIILVVRCWAVECRMTHGKCFSQEIPDAGQTLNSRIERAEMTVKRNRPLNSLDEHNNACPLISPHCGGLSDLACR